MLSSFLGSLPGSFYEQPLSWSHPWLALWTLHYDQSVKFGQEIRSWLLNQPSTSSIISLGKQAGVNFNHPWLLTYHFWAWPWDLKWKADQPFTGYRAGWGWKEGITKNTRKLGMTDSLLSSEWWWYCGRMPISKCIKLYTLNIPYVSYINYIPIRMSFKTLKKLKKNKNIQNIGERET